MAASGDIMLTAAQEAALLEALPDNGDSVTLDVGADGVMRAGVTFTCMSDYPCTVTVMNSADTIVATWASQTLGDGTASAMATGHEPPPVTDPFVELNDASAVTIAAIIQDPIEDGTATPPEGSANGNVSTTVGGLGLEAIGMADDSMVTLTSDLDPNMATDHTRAVIDGTSGVETTAATGGSTLTAGEMNDEITENADSVAAMGWSHRMLFRDWGDTAGTGDGGYETGALVYSNIEMPTMAPFDANLGDMFANSWVEAWFDLDVDTDADGTNDLVTIETATAGWTVPVQNIVITVEGSQAAATQLNIPAVAADARNTANEYRGTYFGAMGTFACVGTGSCVIERAMTGETSFMVADVDPNADGLQLTGQSNWEFTPDPGAMVTVPDQDWMVFGAWLTTPDAAAVGQHRLGVFYTGMNEYEYGDGSQLTGSATYNGSAAGTYVDGADSGLFTARAMLTARFSGDNANTLTGRIDNFKDTAGNFLGADTADMPNDPDAGGENDWVVVLGSTAINATGTFDAAGTVSGSADGVRWDEGNWMAQLYGPGAGNVEDDPQPSGVAGQFRAAILNDATETPTDDITTGVVGAFGAQRMMPDSN